MIEFFRREHIRAFANQVNAMQGNTLLTSIFDEMDVRPGRGSVQSHQISQSRQGVRGTISGVQDMFRRMFGGDT
jgi:hypothetical protein